MRPRRVGKTSFPALFRSCLYLLKIKNGNHLKGQQRKLECSPSPLDCVPGPPARGQCRRPSLSPPHLPYTQAGVGDSTTFAIIN